MSRAAWGRRVGVAGLLGTAAGAALATDLGAWAWAPLAWSAGSLGARLWEAGARPELQVWAPAVARGVHPGRVAVTVRGVPPEAWATVLPGATCFVATAEEDARVRAMGYEPAAWGPVRPGHRWRRARWVPPGRGDPQARWVGATVRLRGTPDVLRGAATTVVGTDIVELPPIPAPLLAAVVEEWAERGIRAGSLSEAMEPADPG